MRSNVAILAFFLSFLLILWVAGALPALLSSITSLASNIWLFAGFIILVALIYAISSRSSDSGSLFNGAGEAGGAVAGAAAGIANSMRNDSSGSNSDSSTVTSPNSSEPIPDPANISSSGESPEPESPTSRVSNETKNDRIPRNPSDSPNTTSSLPEGDKDNLNIENQSDTMSDFSRQLIQDLKDQINHLEKEEQLEMEGIQEQKDAEKKLAEAMQGLNKERAVLEAIMYFNQINLDQPQGQVHSKVEKFIQQSNKIGSVNQLLTEVERVEEFMKEIEVAENEIQDAENRINQAVADEEVVNDDMNEISQLMNKLQQGASKFQEWGMGRQ